MRSQTIGAIALATGVTVQTVRYYERRGLLPKSLRSSGNYRIYADDTMLVVRFIQQAQALGFSLAEIQELLALRSIPQASCGEVRNRVAQKLLTIEGKIALLKRIRRVLVRYVAACSGRGPAQACPILDALGRSHGIEKVAILPRPQNLTRNARRLP